MTLSLNINGSDLTINADPQTPLLWVLRDELGFVGTKFGCGIAMCGACTVLVDGEPTRSCVLSVGDVEGKVTTIEGIGSPDNMHVVQQVWAEHQVAQCGYCQSGQIMAATALLQEIPQPTDDDIDEAMSGNLCRCGTYPRIRAAIHEAATRLQRS